MRHAMSDLVNLGCQHRLPATVDGSGTITLFVKDIFIFYFLRLYLFIFRGRKGERRRETSVCAWLPLARPPLGTWPAAQTSAPAWESNQRPFGLQAAAQSTEPHQPGLHTFHGSTFFTKH